MTRSGIELVGERFERRVVESEERFARQVMESEARLREDFRKEMTVGFSRVNDRFDGNQQQFLSIQKQFTLMHEKFSDLHRQITVQTRWIIGVAVFITVSLKVLDMIVK